VGHGRPIGGGCAGLYRRNAGFTPNRSTPSSPACEATARSSLGQIERHRGSHRVCDVYSPEKIIVEVAERIG
jgi:hypothetical protein